MKITRWQINTVGLVLTPWPPMLLLLWNPVGWVLCPDALCVTFIRQAQRGYDSLGAAGIPDLLAAIVRFPVMTWLLVKVLQKNTLRQTALRIFIWHLLAIVVAVLLVKFGNYAWRQL